MTFLSSWRIVILPSLPRVRLVLPLLPRGRPAQLAERLDPAAPACPGLNCREAKEGALRLPLFLSPSSKQPLPPKALFSLCVTKRKDENARSANLGLNLSCRFPPGRPGASHFPSLGIRFLIWKRGIMVSPSHRWTQGHSEELHITPDVSRLGRNHSAIPQRSIKENPHDSVCAVIPSYCRASRTTELKEKGKIALTSKGAMGGKFRRGAAWQRGCPSLLAVEFSHLNPRHGWRAATRPSLLSCAGRPRFLRGLLRVPPLFHPGLGLLANPSFIT